MECVIIGHGNGLGASSLQTGISLLSDEEMLVTAKKQLNKTKMGAFLIPGYGTFNDLKLALKCGVDLVCVAAHCTEANITRQHIEYLRNQNIDAYGILMMCHMTTLEILAEQVLKMQQYGATGVILMDSAGASTPKMVSDMINVIKSKININIGFHAHNNLGLAVGNSYIALESGANIIDATTRGFGAGAGNCQLEALIAVLEKQGINTGINLYKLLDISENIIAKIYPNGMAINSLSIISGISGVFSSFVTHVKNASNEFKVDPYDIFIELAKRKVVGGQEDMVVDIAINLSQKTSKTMVIV